MVTTSHDWSESHCFCCPVLPTPLTQHHAPLEHIAHVCVHARHGGVVRLAEERENELESPHERSLTTTVVVSASPHMLCVDISGCEQ
jgi:hypothetical protein